MNNMAKSYNVKAEKGLQDYLFVNFLRTLVKFMKYGSRSFKDTYTFDGTLLNYDVSVLLMSNGCRL